MVRVRGPTGRRTSDHVVARLLLLLPGLLLGLGGHPVGLIGKTPSCYVWKRRSDHVPSLTLLLTRPHIHLTGGLGPHGGLAIGVPGHVVLVVWQRQAQGKVSSVKVSLARLRVAEVLLILASCVRLLWAILVSNYPLLLLLLLLVLLLWLSRLAWLLLWLLRI